MNKKYKIRLTASERQHVQKIKNSAGESATIRKRAEIILLADECVGKPMTQEEIALRIGTTAITVSNTVKAVCDRGIKDSLIIRKRSEPPRTAIVTGEIEARIIATACGEAPKGYARWTVRLLTDKLLELNILQGGSRETVRRTLKKLNLSLI